MKHTWAFLVLVCGALVVNANAQLQQVGTKLVGTGAATPSTQGWSVSLSADGNTAIVGGEWDNSITGAAWIFTRIGGAWSQQGTKLVGTGAVGGAVGQGYSVSLSSDGNTALVGGPGDSGDVGAAWVFTRTGGVWSQQGTKLLGTAAVGTSEQGFSVSLSSDGNTAILGGYRDNGYAGAAWVFVRSGGVWSQQGTKLVGTGALGAAYQGWSVALSSDGSTAIVGGRYDNYGVGAAWVYTRVGSTWTQNGAKLVGTGAAGFADQGSSVALSSDGNTAIVGGYLDNSDAGAAWVFTRSLGVWSQQGTKLVGTGSVGGFVEQGESVALSSDGNRALVGGSYDNGGAGAAWVFRRTGGVWAQEGSKLVGTGAVGPAYQGVSVALSSNGNTAIVGGWGDNSNVGAAWIYLDGQPGSHFVSDVPLDQGGIVTVNWSKSAGDEPPATIVTEYWVWRGIIPASAPGRAVTLSRKEYLRAVADGKATPLTFMSTHTPGANVPLAGDIYWQYMTSLPSHGLARYSFACPTLADSTPQGIPWQYFFITAATSDPDLYWDSTPDSGYSVDNLSPLAPGGVALALVTSNSVRVSWQKDRTDPDVGYYKVYRATTSGVPLSAATVVATTTDTVAVDAGVNLTTTYYYRVVTVDIHGNPSLPSVELSTNGINAVVEESPLPTVFALAQNYPNPFNPSTEIQYSVPVSGLVSLKVYDILGQEVATLRNEETPAGIHTVTWNASSFPSGLYFVRMNAGKFSDVRKVLLLK